LVFEEKFEIAVVLFGRGVVATAVVDELVVFGVPVGFVVFAFGGEGRGPLIELFLALVFGHGEELAVVGSLSAAPAGEVCAVEEGGETGGGRVFGEGDEGEYE